jgi:hypothetical protein
VPRRPITPLLLLFCVTLLTACGSDRVPGPTVYVKQDVPAVLLECSAEPAVPQAETQAEVAEYVVQLSDAGQDCRDKLAQVRKLVSP